LSKTIQDEKLLLKTPGELQGGVSKKSQKSQFMKELEEKVSLIKPNVNFIYKALDGDQYKEITKEESDLIAEEKKENTPNYSMENFKGRSNVILDMILKQ
jgi:hypothetical protein